MSEYHSEHIAPLQYVDHLRARYDQLTVVKRRLGETMAARRVPYAVLSNGSSAYGFNAETTQEDGLNDLDCYMILPSETSYADFARALDETVETKDIPSEEEYKGMFAMQSSYDAVRATGVFDGVPVSFHCMPLGVFRDIISVTGLYRPVKHKLPNKPKYKKWITECAVGEPNITLRFPGEVHQLEKTDDVRVDLFMSRRVQKFGADIQTIGILADRILLSEVLHDHPRVMLDHGLHRLWYTFVKSYFKVNPNASEADIIDSFYRSDRFSTDFKAALTSRIRSMHFQSKTSIMAHRDHRATLEQSFGEPVDTSELEVSPHNPHCMIDTRRGKIYKKRNPEYTLTRDTLRYYAALKVAGIPVAPPPRYRTDVDGTLLEEQDYLGQKTAYDIVAYGSMEEAEHYFTETLLPALERLISSQGNINPLQVSLDAHPANFTPDGRYFDYFPPIIMKYFNKPHRLMNPHKLWEVALIKHARARPEAFDAFYCHMLKHLESNKRDETIEHIRNKPFAQMIEKKHEGDGKFIEEWFAQSQRALDKDDFSALVVLLVSRLDEGTVNALYGSLSGQPTRRLERNEVIEKLLFYLNKKNFTEYKNIVDGWRALFN